MPRRAMRSAEPQAEWAQSTGFLKALVWVRQSGQRSRESSESTGEARFDYLIRLVIDVLRHDEALAHRS